MKLSVYASIFCIIFAIAIEDSISSSSSDKSYSGYHIISPYCVPSEPIRTPRNVLEVQAIVLKAFLTGQKVKAFGSRHSVSDIFCTDGIALSMDNFNSAQLNWDKTVTFGAGIKLQAALEYLESKNRALIQIPGYTGLTIGGCIGTGAHGSSLKHVSSISEQMVSMTVVDGYGKIRVINGRDELRAAKVHLGLLGIVVSVTLKTVPLYKMISKREIQPESILLDGTAVALARAHDYMQVAWFPSKQEVVVVRANFTYDLSIPGNAYATLFYGMAEDKVAGALAAYDAIQATRNTKALHAIENNTALSLYQKVIGRLPIYTEDGVNFVNPAVGIGWRLQSSQCGDMCSWDYGNNSLYDDETSLACDIDDFAGIITSIKSVIAKIPVAFPFAGVVFRFSNPSDGLLAITNHPKSSVILDMISVPNRIDVFNQPKDGVGAYQAIAQLMLNKYKGKPHWGKNGQHYFSKDIIKQTAQNREKFIKIMNDFDPKGVFLNKFGKRLLGLDTAADTNPQAKHCALQDICICSKNSDCADTQECTTIKDVDGILDYHVCKDTQIFNNKPVGPYDPYNISSVFAAIF